MFITPDLGSLN